MSQLSEEEIKAVLHGFLSANENLLSAFLAYSQSVEYYASGDPEKISLEVIDAQVKQVMEYLR